VPHSRRVWVSKHAAGHCGVGKFTKKWKKYDADECPRCGEPEDKTHVWLCTGRQASEVWEKSIKGLLPTWLPDNKICPEISEAICSGLFVRLAMVATPDSAMPEVFQNQTQIGWQALLEGCPALGWAEAQQRYLELVRSGKTGKRWLVALIQKLWYVAWDQWEHRNGILHNIEEDLHSTALDSRIRQGYEQGCKQFARAEQLLFRKCKFDQILTSLLSYHESWIARIEVAGNRPEQ